MTAGFENPEFDKVGISKKLEKVLREEYSSL
jgi:hypothetical protein